MNAAGVCQQCRRRALARVSRRYQTIQWQSRAAFVTLDNPKPPEVEVQSQHPPRSDKKQQTVGEKKSSQSSPSKRSPRRNVRTLGSLLEDLFEEGIRPPDLNASRQKAQFDADTVELYENVEALNSMLADPKQAIGDVWHFFTAKLSVGKWYSDTKLLPRPSTFHVVARKLLNQLMLARKHDVSQKVDLPTAFDIARTFKGLGLLLPRDIEQLLWSATNRILASQSAEEQQPLIDDLLDMWRLVFQMYGGQSTQKPGSSAPISDEWPFVQVPKARDVIDIKHGSRVDYIFSHLLLWSAKDRTRGLAFAALASLAKLVDPQVVRNQEYLRVNQFVLIVTRALSLSRIQSQEIDSYLRPPYIPFPDSSTFDSVALLANLELMKRTPTTAHHLSGLGTQSTLRDLKQLIVKKDLLGVERLWANYQLYASAQASGAPSQEFCNHFIMAFMALQQPNRAVDVWNSMIQMGIVPTLATWNAMLEGCVSSRKISELENVWGRLLDSGQLPDQVCWTTRISGLANSGKPAILAVRALEEMGRAWLMYRKGRQPRDDGGGPGPVKPSVTVVNAAVAGYLRRRYDELAQHVLAWGGKFGIQPDIVTYNTLLRSLVRRGRREEVQKLLQSMQDQGVEADVATFTTMLDEMTLPSEDYSAEERNEMVEMILEEMKAAGLKPNERTYGKIVYALLHGEQPDMTGVATTMTRMMHEGYEPSSQIYTMLVKHHFVQTPPEMEAVALLLKRIKLSNKTMDNIFWDRVIEGYAAAGDTVSAMRTYSQYDRAGSRVGWLALEALLRALMQNNERDLAQELVTNTRSNKGGPVGQEEKGVEGQHSFWYAARELGFLGTWEWPI